MKFSTICTILGAVTTVSAETDNHRVIGGALLAAGISASIRQVEG